MHKAVLVAKDFNSIVSTATSFFLSFISITYINNPVNEISSLGALLIVAIIFFSFSLFTISFLYRNTLLSFLLSIVVVTIIFLLTSSNSSAIASISIALATVGTCQLYVLFASR